MRGAGSASEVEGSGRPRRNLNSPPRSPVRRRFVLGLASLLVVAAIAITVAGGPQGPPTQVDDDVSGRAFTPQPERRFIVVGTTSGRQFTDEQFRLLVENFGIVQLTKFHGAHDITLHHEAARRLVTLRPGLEVFPYFSMKYWFEQNRWDGVVIDPEWLLRDNQGNVVERYERRDGRQVSVATYVDLSKPEYRAWALDVLASWLEAAPYAGIFFDATEPIGDYGREDELEWWDELLGQDRIAAYNQGMRELLAAAKTLAGPNRQVLFNGIAPSPPRGPGRNLDLLLLADGAGHERFCLDIRGHVHALEEDLSLLTRERSKRLLFRTNFRESFEAGERDRYQRFCLGAFLLGWEPGRSYFNIGRDYTAGQLDEENPDVDVNLGRPRGRYRRAGDLAVRDFENGVLYINLGPDPVSVELPVPLTEVRGGRVLARQGAGNRATVPAQDAVFFLHSAFLGQAPG